MLNYLEVVKDYIERPRTNYALMVSGDWGNGKTYFINNSVIPMLKEKDKRPIYISLNGLSSVEEISRQIYLETSFLSNEKIKKITDSKSVKYVTQFAKVVHNVASILNAAGSGENNIDYEELINLKDNIVLCFDDLERCNINIIEILGYINKFVEHDKIKTIIIGNEQEIRDINIEEHKELKMLVAINSIENNKEIDKDKIISKVSELFTEQKQYEVIKEKVIGKTLFYAPNPSVIVDNIIEEYNETNSEVYYAFLKENKDDILNVFNRSERKNIRVLKLSISDFAKIHQSLHDQLEENQYKKELIAKYFIPALICGIEFRIGTLSADNLTKSLTASISPSFFMLSERQSNIKIFSKYFNGYAENKEFYTSKFINMYIANSLLEEQELINESKNLIKEWIKRDKRESKPTSIQKLISGLTYLENQEFQECIDDVLTKVNESYYPLNHYTNIFYHIEVFLKNSLLTENRNDIMMKFTKGIENAREFTLEEDRFSLLHIDENQKSDDLKQIEQLVESRHKLLSDSELMNYLNSLLELLPYDVEKFTTGYYEITREKKFRPVLQYLDIEGLFSKIIVLKNAEISAINSLFNSIYDFTNINEFFKEDYEYIMRLVKLIDENKSHEQSIKKLNLDILSRNLKNIAKRLNQ